jgi:hypothetical protein
VLVEETTGSIGRDSRLCPVLFDEQNMAVLEDMVSAARGSDLGRRAQRAI